MSERTSTPSPLENLEVAASPEQSGRPPEQTERKAAGQRTCSVNGCGKKIQARGLCCTHYYRLYVSEVKNLRAERPIGTLQGPQPKKPCSVVGCDRPMFCNGLCQTHSMRLRRTGRVDPDSPISPSLRHGLADCGEYKVWSAMLQRCNNPKCRVYRHYGGRGITVCIRWLKFEDFFTDMGPRPFRSAWLERLNNNIGYSLDNCAWVTPSQNGRNKRNSRFLTLGNERLCVTAWSEKTGIPIPTIYGRIKSGWPIERVLTEPPNPRMQRG